MSDKMTRKEFFQKLVLLGITAAGGGALLSSCGKKEEPKTTTQRSTPPPARESQTAQKAQDPCSDVSGLTQAELTMRKDTLKYVTHSPDPNKVCDNCKFWQPGEVGAPCGACTLIKGPIAPKGYCTSWFAKEG
jgi:hypothetical protein